MRLPLNHKAIAAIGAAFAATVMAGAADAAGYSDMAAYSHPYGMASGQETQAINAFGARRQRQPDASSTARSPRPASASNPACRPPVPASTGSGSNGSGNIFGGASAIGNSLNVITNGSNNTVIVTSTQTNNGDQTANVSVNGK